MTHYSYSQLEQLWINAGGSRSLAPLMAAIAEAESGGNSNAYNPSGASGLWQILGAVNPADQGSLFTPSVNAHEAVLKYQSQGLDAWQTYTNGAYRQFLQGSVPPSAVPGSSSTSPGTSTEASGGVVSDIGDALKSVGTLVHDTAEVLNWAFELFKPGQMMRVGALAVAGGGGYATVRLYASPGADNQLPLIFLLGGVTLGSAYVALRPWPESSGHPIRPAVYVQDIFKGDVPAGTPPADDTEGIEAGLYAILGIWIVSKTAGAVSGAGGIFGGILGKLWTWAKSLGKAAEEAPVEEIPALAFTTPAASAQGTTSGVELV